MTFRFDICEINCKHCSQFKRCILDLWVKTCLALLAVCIWGLYLFTVRFMLVFFDKTTPLCVFRAIQSADYCI